MLGFRERSFYQLVFFILFSSFLILLARSFDLMVIRGNYFSFLSEENRLEEIRIEAVRGKILSRRGEVLAEDRVVYQNLKGEKISKDEALKILQQEGRVRRQYLRFYPLGEAAAHVVGFLGKATKEEVGKVKCQQKGEIGINDWLGRGGLEQQYDCFLRGRPGKLLVELDTFGRVVRELGKIPAQKGEDLLTTLDAGLQKKVWEVMRGKKGAVIVLDPLGGAVLSMVSSPSFEPNFFTWQFNKEKVREYLSDEEGMVFLNRAISGVYHPGSVFKPIVGLAALEEGKIDSSTVVEDVGVIRIGKWEFANWYWTEYGKKEGRVNLVKAIKRSNDIFFYKVGEWLGAEKLAEWAEKFGLGRTTGIDLPSELAGVVPSPHWKRRVKKEAWFLGNTYHFAIGQGDLNTTPLQIAVATAAVANGGRICRPHLVEVRNQGNLCQDLGVKKENLELVKKGMIEACSLGGTGFEFFNFQPQVGCKTGTAEVGDGSGDSHAWFVVFAPASNPKILVVVFVERGGSGAYVAAPIAKEIMEYLREEGYLGT